MNGGSPSPIRPQTVADVIEILESKIEKLPKRLKQCADFTRQHLHLIAVSTVSDMAKSCDVAPSVYMRFCQALGFSGYSEMQMLFRAQYTEFRPNYEERLANLKAEGTVGTNRLLADFAESGHRSLLSLSNTVTSHGLERIAKGMAEARVVHLIGLQRAFAVVSNMAYMFDKLGVPVNLHSGAGMLDFTTSISKGDVLFAVTFAPFSQGTIDLAKATYARKIKVFGLTDSDRCPIVESADEILIAHEDEVAGFRALNASITLTTALSVAVRALREES